MTTSATWIGATGDKSGNWATKADWSTGTVPTGSTVVTLDLAGGYGVLINAAASAYSITIDNAVATSFLSVDANLTIASGITVTSGLLKLLAGGTINGGVISIGTDGTVAYKGGSLNGVAFHGALELTASGAELTIKNGIILKGAGGTGTGTIDLTGFGALLTVDNTTSLLNATMNVGNDTADSVLNFNDTLSGGQTFTLGGTLTLNQTGTNFSIAAGGYTTDQLVNKGSMNLTETNGITDVYGAGSFTNDGSITIGSGNSLSAETEGAFTNNGTITIDASASLFVESNFINSSTGVVNDTSGGGLSAVYALTNDGTINVADKQEFAGTITGTGTIAVAAGGQADFDGTVASSQTIALTGTGSVLEFGTGFAGMVSGLASGDLILMHGLAAASVAISGDDLVITPTTGSAFDVALTGTVPPASTPIAFGSIIEDGTALSFISIGGTNYTLAAGGTIAGGAADNLITATAASITSTDNINAGSGDFNIMELSGAGTFNLALPATLTGVAYFLASEGQAASGSIASTQQIVDTRAGLTGTILVVSDGKNTANSNVYGITINGAADSMVFNLENAQGADTINLGSKTESVEGSSWSGQVTTINASTDGEGHALITDYGGTFASAGHTVLHMSVGGSISLNTGDQDMTVDLSATASTLYLGSLGFIVAHGGAGNDTIWAGGQEQMLSGGAGTNILVGSTSGLDVFSDTSAHLSGDTIKNFTSTDQIVATDMTYTAGMIATWTQTSSTEGTLSFTDGTHSAAVTLTGSFNNSFLLEANTSGTGVVAVYA